MRTMSALSRTLTLTLGAVVLTAGSPGPAEAQQTCRQLPRGVVGWWPGDHSTQDVTLSANNAQLFNGATYGAAVVGEGFILDGVNDRVDIADAPNLRLQRFTLAAWVQLDVNPQWACIICRQYGGGSSDSFSLWMNNGVLQGGMFGYAEAAATGTLPVGKFFHAAVTWDGTIIRLYRDGKIVSTAAGPAGAIPYDADQVLIGAEDNGVNAYTAFLKGAIDEPMIFGRALSDCEIRSLAEAGPGGHCKGDADGDLIPDCQDNCPSVANAAQVDTDADGTGDLCDCAPANAVVAAVPGDRNLLGFTSPDGPNWCGDPAITGTGTVYDVIRGNLGALPVTTANTTCRSRCLPTLTGLAAWWIGDGSTVDLVAANNGTLENGATYDAGFVRTAFAVDGINVRVRTGNMSMGSAFTVAAWVNSAAVNQGSYHRIVENSYATGFELGTDAAGTGYKFIVNTPGSPYGTVSGGKLSPGNWQLVIGTYDGTTGALYVDGKLVSSATMPTPAAVNLPVYIGAYAGGGTAWKGRIDEVQLYNWALTAAEAQTMFESGSAGACKAALGGTDAETTVPWVADLATPTPGHGFWYLYRGRNACGAGSYGFATGGAERLSTICN